MNDFFQEYQDAFCACDAARRERNAVESAFRAVESAERRAQRACPTDVACIHEFWNRQSEGWRHAFIARREARDAFAVSRHAMEHAREAWKRAGCPVSVECIDA